MQNYYDNKVNSHNFLEYGFRVLFLIISEIFFDWIKDIIIFKISFLNAKYLKNITLEIAVFHDKMKYNCFSITNGSEKSSLKNDNKNKNELVDYLNVLENYKLQYFNKDKLDKHLNYVDFENLLTIDLQHNVLVICIFVC